MASITVRDRVILPPGPRTMRDDFVQKGLRMEPAHIAKVREDWRLFLMQHDSLPVDVFSGRGVVLIGGKLQYLVPSLVAIRALRRTGCTLPVELWFPDNEAMPTPELQQLLGQMGVHIQTLPVPAALGQVLPSTCSAVLVLPADGLHVVEPT
jgi:alpha 1,2-mannosyltransferase